MAAGACLNPGCRPAALDATLVQPAEPPPKPAAAAPIQEAYGLLRRTLLEVDGSPSPLFLVIGLPGSGKTTYLAMLGALLNFRQQRFWFPFADVQPRWVRVEELVDDPRSGVAPERAPAIKARIKDLVNDFAMPLYSRHIARQEWPAPTAPGEQDTTFLVANIVRNLRPLAKLVTMETAGEEWEGLMRDVMSLSQRKPARTPVQKVLFEMMDLAEGFIILVDPGHAKRTDEALSSFFMVLREELKPRALRAFFAELQGAMGAGGVPLSADPAERMKRLRQEEERRRRFQARVEDQVVLDGAKLREVERRLQSAEGDAAGSEGVAWLREHMEAFLLGDERFSGKVHEARTRLLPVEAEVPKEERARLYARYYLELARFCARHLAEICARRLRRALPQGERSVLWELKDKFGLSDRFALELEKIDPAAVPAGPGGFRNLRNIAIVVTKSDRHPVVHPAADYPHLKLPACAVFLPEIQDLVRMCGGQVRCYSASATGYTELYDGAEVPGRVNTQTPINILEPLFDMLGL
jgi:hypothetical protein